MGECEFCKLSKDDKKWLLYEDEDWYVFLADRQDYLGRCIIVLKQHCANLSELTMEQWLSLKIIVNSLEKMLKKELGATMFNWSCLMNDAYKSGNQQPHLHFHFRPRYADTVLIGKYKYCDHEFSHHYINNADIQIDNETAQTLFLHLKEKSSIYFASLA